jgi:hypothetical protein
MEKITYDTPMKKVEKSRVFPVCTEIQLPLQGDLVDTVSKGELAKTVYPMMTFDYAFPETFLDKVMDAVLPEIYFPRWEDISLVYRRTFSFGIVWGYPKKGFGSISGYPAPITLNAYRLVQHYWKYFADMSFDYYDFNLIQSEQTLFQRDVDLLNLDDNHVPMTKKGFEYLSEMIQSPKSKSAA